MPTREELVKQFDEEVDSYGNYVDIDPDGTYCWYSLIVGWAIAKGLSPTEAAEFATHVRYNTDLG